MASTGGLFVFVSKKKGGIGEGQKERGLNIEITVYLHSFLSLPKHAAGEGTTTGVDAGADPDRCQRCECIGQN